MYLHWHITAHTVERPTTLLNSQRTEVMGCAGMCRATARGAHIAGPAAPLAAGEERERERERRRGRKCVVARNSAHARMYLCGCRAASSGAHIASPAALLTAGEERERERK